MVLSCMGRRASGASMYNYMHANGLANTQSLCMCVRMHVYHNHTHTNSPTHPSARTYSHIMYTNMTEYYAHHTNAQEDAVQGMTAWFEGVGLVPPDAKAVAVACFQQHTTGAVLPPCRTGHTPMLQGRAKSTA